MSKSLSLLLIAISLIFNFAATAGNNHTITITPNTNFTGRGNINEDMLRLAIFVEGNSSAQLKDLMINLDGTSNISDIDKIKVYSTKAEEKFDSRKADTYSLLGEYNPKKGDIRFKLSGKLVTGKNYIWITCDIKDKANEGNIIALSAKSISTSTQIYKIENAPATREILLGRKLIYAPGDYNSTHYRIPAIVTAHDGSLIIATDKRKANQTDLPEDIDIVVNRSTDNGKTWSEPLTIAQGTGRYHGYGDAALVKTNEPGGILCIYVGGTGFFESTPENPMHTYISKSADNGITWSSPKDITSQLFGSECNDSIRSKWFASFCGSGAGLLASDGTIYFVATIIEKDKLTKINEIANYVYSSRDNGNTWDVSSCVKPKDANEAKILELNNGTLLVSIRNQSKGARYYATSSDKGKTWSEVKQWNEMIEPGCNGDIIYYTSKKKGDSKNRILHSVPNDESKRENVSVFLSYDEGETWPIKKSICKTSSAYSSLCILSDGTIGAYVEENYNTDDFSMFFLNFSLDWLTNGVDTYLSNTKQH